MAAAAGISSAPGADDHVDGGAGGVEGGAGAGQQHLADRVVITRFDDEEARAGQARRGRGGALRLGHAPSLARRRALLEGAATPRKPRVLGGRQPRRGGGVAAPRKRRPEAL